MTSYHRVLTRKAHRDSELEIKVGLDTIPPYAPAPLNPYGLLINEKPYVMVAFNGLCTTFDTNLAALESAPAQAVTELAADEVTGGFYHRVEKNSYKEMSDDCTAETAELYERASMGMATPEETLALLRQAPESLVALEMAAQSRPFDWDTTEMDAAMEAIMDAQAFVRFSPEEQHPQYFFKRASNTTDAQAAVIVREADRGFIAYDNTNGAALVQRDVFVLDLAQPETQGLYEEMMIWLVLNHHELSKGGRSVPYPKELIAEFIEEQLQAEPEERSSAIHPLARSYFAYDIEQQAEGKVVKARREERIRSYVKTAAQFTAAR